MRFSILTGLALLASALLFAEHAQAGLYYNPATGRIEIGKTRLSRMFPAGQLRDDDSMIGSDDFDGISFGLAVLASSPRFSARPQPADYYVPNGGFDIGRARLFTVLADGQVNYSDTMTGKAIVEGNLGIGGTGNFQMSGGQINGDLYVRTTATYTLSGSAQVNHIFHDSAHNPPIDNALSDLQNLSDWGWMQLPTHNYTTNGNPFVVLQNVNITNANQSITLAAGANTRVVLRLTDFVMSAGTFTLQGTATTTFLINIAGKFSLSNAQIILAGIPAANVLFNIHGQGQQLTLNNSQLSGYLLALGRRVTVNGTTIHGRLFADQVNINAGAHIISQ
jgi:choice-of-anchor A domain-containing protein